MATIDTEQTNHLHKTASGTSRRTVLLSVGAVGAAAGLAACGSSGGTTSHTSTSDNSTTKAASGSNLAKSADIPVGGGKIFPSQLIVVTQPTAGEFKAFSAVCTHQGCTVGSIANGLIMCPCHGSEYSITDGSVKRAAEANQKPLPTKTVTVTNGEINVA